MKRIALMMGWLLLAGSPVLAQGVMTPERFKEIAGASGDPVPLVPQLAPVPFWTNSTVSNVMTYASGKVYNEMLLVTARTVGGKYVVFTARSPASDQTASSILTYDEKAVALKTYGIYGDGHGGDIVTEGTVIYDFAKKSYTISSTYGDGFKEFTQGYDNGVKDSAETTVYNNGALVLTRETVTRPVVAGK